MDKKYFNAFSSFLIILIFIILSLHLFNIPILIIDNITLILLALLILVFLSPFITKIKVGDFEAEIGKKDIVRLEKNAAKIPDKGEEQTPESLGFEEEIYSLLESDYNLALVKLRLELEQLLKKLIIKKSGKKLEKVGIGQMINIIKMDNLLEDSYLNAIKDVASICNRAAHGEEVSKQIAERIIEIGLDLLDSLYSEYYALVIKPIKQQEIKEIECKKYSNAKYEVTTVIPYVNKPVMKTYLLDKEELDEFLDNYGMFAEFIIKIKGVD